MDRNHKNGEMTLNKLAGKVDDLATTVDKLAIATVKGFDDVKTELKKEVREFKLEVNNRFNRVENRLDRIEENSYDQVNFNEKAEREITKLKQKVTTLENKVIRQ